MPDFNKTAQLVSNYSGMMPEQLVDHMASKNQELNHVAPTIGPQIQATTMSGLNFLASKLPRPGTAFPGDEPVEPSNSHKDQFMDYHEIVDDPLKALEHVKNGTLNTKHIEALQAVYPNLYQHMQEQVMQHATPKALQKLKYPVRIAVAKFLGHPMDASLQPGVVAANQANFNMPAAMQASGGPGRKSGGSTLGGLNKLHLAQRSATRTQEEEEDQD
jgi:hypothetical protein